MSIASIGEEVDEPSILRDLFVSYAVFVDQFPEKPGFLGTSQNKTNYTGNVIGDDTPGNIPGTLARTH